MSTGQVREGHCDSSPRAVGKARRDLGRSSLERGLESARTGRCGEPGSPGAPASAGRRGRP